MEDLQTSEDLAFVGEDVENILLEVVNSVLSGKDYEAERVPHWTDQICEAAVKSLTDLNKPFKYTISCFIMQKNGAGVVSACSAFCDNVNDGVASIKWPTDKSKDSNKSMVCIATVGAMHL